MDQVESLHTGSQETDASGGDIDAEIGEGIQDGGGRVWEGHPSGLLSAPQRVKKIGGHRGENPSDARSGAQRWLRGFITKEDMRGRRRTPMSICDVCHMISEAEVRSSGAKPTK